MINPVNNYYQPNMNDSKTKSINASGESEKFSLEAGLAKDNEQETKTTQKEEEDGVVYEHGSSSSGFSSRGGDSYISSVSREVQKEDGTGSSMPILEVLGEIKAFMQKVLSSVKEVFSAIWEEKPLPNFSESLNQKVEELSDFERELLYGEDEVEASKDGSLEQGIGSMAEGENTLMDSSAPNTSMNSTTSNASMAATTSAAGSGMITDQAIRKALRDGDRNSFRQLISENGSKHPARNSSLLTYYDAKGQFVEIDPSEKQRILHTDKNVKKL